MDHSAYVSTEQITSGAAGCHRSMLKSDFMTSRVQTSLNDLSRKRVHEIMGYILFNEL
jgi:hypothetical protein